MINHATIHLKHLPAVFLVCAHLLLPVLLLLKLRVCLLSSLVRMILTHPLRRGGATLTYRAVRFCRGGSICVGTAVSIVVHVGSVVVLLFIMQAMELEDAGKHCQSLHVMELAKVVKPVHEYVGQDGMNKEECIYLDVECADSECRDDGSLIPRLFSAHAREPGNEARMMVAHSWIPSYSFTSLTHIAAVDKAKGSFEGLGMGL